MRVISRRAKDRLHLLEKSPLAGRGDALGKNEGVVRRLLEVSDRIQGQRPSIFGVEEIGNDQLAIVVLEVGPFGAEGFGIQGGVEGHQNIAVDVYVGRSPGGGDADDLQNRLDGDSA